MAEAYSHCKTLFDQALTRLANYEQRLVFVSRRVSSVNGKGASGTVTLLCRMPCSLVPRPSRRNGLGTYTSSNCYFRCQRVGRTNQISERCHMTTVSRIVTCVETSQSCPFIAIVDRLIALV